MKETLEAISAKLILIAKELGTLEPSSKRDKLRRELKELAENIHEYKIEEIAKYASFHGAAIVAQPLVMNLDRWNKLPADIQKIFVDEAFRKEATEKFIVIHDEQDKVYKKIMADKGVTFLKVDPVEQDKMWDLYKEAVLRQFPEELAKKNMKPQALKLLDAWLKAVTGKDLKFWDQKFGITR